MVTKGDAHKTLDSLFRLVGVPRLLIPDNAKELTEGEFKWKPSRAQAHTDLIEAYTPNPNIAKDGICEVKRAYQQTMMATNTPTFYGTFVLSMQHLSGSTPCLQLGN